MCGLWHDTLDRYSSPHIDRIRERFPEARPDFNRLATVFERGIPDRVPFMELFHDTPIMEAILGERIPEDHEDREGSLRRRIDFWYILGYDYLTLGADYDMPMNWDDIDDTADLKKVQRSWAAEGKGVITTRKEFEQYPWPDLSEIYFDRVLAARDMLPPGMKLLGSSSGVFEYASWLMGLETFSLALYDDPQLVRDVVDRVGKILHHIHGSLAAMGHVGGIFIGDDMGGKMGTLVSPKHLKELVIPWHRMLAETVHSHDKYYILHNCGDIELLMEDFLDVVNIDARHSYEEVILPVTEAKKRWGDRCAIIGGVDVDRLCRYSDEDLRSYVSGILDVCAVDGGYALGSGNSLANYIPVAAFLAMLEEGYAWKM